LHLFLEALVKNFKMLIFLRILEKQSAKKNKKKLLSKIFSKWPLNSKWLPLQNLLVKTTNYFFSIGSCIPKFYRKETSRKFKMAPIFNMEIFLASFCRNSYIRQEYQHGKIFIHILEEQTHKTYPVEYGVKNMLSRISNF
jgi:hypothetical protein